MNLSPHVTDEGVLLSVDPATESDYGCEMTYRVLPNGTIEVLDVKFHAPVDTGVAP